MSELPHAKLEASFAETKEANGRRLHFISAEVAMDAEAGEFTIGGLSLKSEAPRVNITPFLGEATGANGAVIIATNVVETAPDHVRFRARRIPGADEPLAKVQAVRFDLLVSEPA